MRFLKKIGAWLWDLEGNPGDWDHPKNKEFYERNMYGIHPGATSLEKEQTRKDLQVVLWSLDYHAHRIRVHKKGNTAMRADIDRLRKQLRNYL